MPFMLPPININLTARDFNCCNGALCCFGARQGGTIDVNSEKGLTESAELKFDHLPPDTPLQFDITNNCLTLVDKKAKKLSKKNAGEYTNRCLAAIQQCFSKLTEIGSIQREVLLGYAKIDLVQKYWLEQPMTVKDYEELAFASRKLAPVIDTIVELVKNIVAVPKSSDHKVQIKSKTQRRLLDIINSQGVLKAKDIDSIKKHVRRWERITSIEQARDKYRLCKSRYAEYFCDIAEHMEALRRKYELKYALINFKDLVHLMHKELIT